MGKQKAKLPRVTGWDRFLASIAPGWGQRRVRAKATLAALSRSYKAAAAGPRQSGWTRSTSDANSAAQAALAPLRELSRDLRRNNGWARRGVEVIVNNTVGWGIEGKPLAKNPEVVAKATEIWAQWAGTTRCDYDGRLNFNGLQELATATMVESGSALIVLRRAKSTDGLSVPLRIRVLEPDYIDTTKDGMTNGDNPIIQGIETDGKGRRVAYWLFKQHPGATQLTFGQHNPFASERVPAEQIIHMFRSERPGQMHGVPWLASAITKLNDFDDYDDARLIQQRIASCFGVIVTDVNGDNDPLGTQDPDDDQLETLEPGMVKTISPGKSIEVLNPPSTTGHSEYTTTNLQRIAASIGVTYEDLTGDYSRVNFSSARMARLSHWQNVFKWRWHTVIPQLCDGVWDWIMQMAAGLENWPEVPTAQWTAPPMPMLEPDKEGLALTRLVRSGALTLSEAIRQQGNDPAAHLQEYADSNAELDRLEIWLDSDPRRTTVAGQAQITGGDQAGDEGVDQPEDEGEDAPSDADEESEE